MAEFLVGLVCIMLLVAGLQQIALLSDRGFKAMNNARHKMAEQQVYPVLRWSEFNFSAPVTPGPDGRAYTADDDRPVGDDTFYQDYEGYLGMVYDDLIDNYLDSAGRIDSHIDLQYSEGVFSSTAALDMNRAADQQAVEVVPFMDKVLGRDRILVGHDVWMPRWGGIP